MSLSQESNSYKQGHNVIQTHTTSGQSPHPFLQTYIIKLLTMLSFLCIFVKDQGILK